MAKPSPNEALKDAPQPKTADPSSSYDSSSRRLGPFLLLALVAHPAFFSHGLLDGDDWQPFLAKAETEIRAVFVPELDIVVDEVIEETPVEEEIIEEDPAEPEEAPVEPPPDAPVSADTTPAPAAAPAEAAAIVTSEAESLDFTSDSFTMVSGTADRSPGGATSALGTSKAPVKNPNAKVGGVQNGTGTAAAVAAPTGPDLSHPPKLMSTSWNCSFPSEADAAQIHNMSVKVLISVGIDGKPSKVSVLGDPGYGFGKAARLCAMSRSYSPASDRSGKTIAGSLGPISIQFER